MEAVSFHSKNAAVSVFWWRRNPTGKLRGTFTPLISHSPVNAPVDLQIFHSLKVESYVLFSKRNIRIIFQNSSEYS